MENCLGMVNKVYFYLREGRQILFLWLYLGFIYTAEIVLPTVSPYWGLAIHIGILFSLYLHAAYYLKNDIAKLYLALSLLPLCRILNLAVPVIQMPTFYWYPLVGIPMWAAIYLLVKTVELDPRELGLRVRQVFPQVITGCCLGIPLGFLGYFILKPQPLISELKFPTLLGYVFVLLVFVVFLEEFYFRGVLYYLASKIICPRFAMFFTSIAYGSLHTFYLSYEYELLVFCTSLILIWLVKHFKSLLSAILAHAIAIIGFYLIWPFCFN